MLTGHPVQESGPGGPRATRERGVCELDSPVSLECCVQDKSPVVLLSKWALTKTNSRVLK